MIFILGFLVAGLLTLLFLPAFGRRATRLAQRRLEMVMPLSMEEIVAERDQLRAEFAAEHRRVEQRAEAIETRHALALGELGRRDSLIGSLEAELADTKRAAIEAHIRLEHASRETREAQAELAAVSKEAFDALGVAERRTEALAALQRRYSDADAAANDLAHTVVTLEARVAELETQLTEATREVDELRAAHDELAGAAGQAHLKQQLEAVSGQKDVLEAALETAREEYRALRLQLAAREDASRTAASPAEAEETALLRRAIGDIGADVVRLAAALEREAPAVAPALAERVRELQASAGRLG